MNATAPVNLSPVNLGPNVDYRVTLIRSPGCTEGILCLHVPAKNGLDASRKALLKYPKAIIKDARQAIPADYIPGAAAVTKPAPTPTFNRDPIKVAPYDVGKLGRKGRVTNSNDGRLKINRSRGVHIHHTSVEV